MYVNKCIKCGREFETKNPKRVICPDCLYPDKNMMVNSSSSADGNQEVMESASSENYSTESNPQFYNSYSAGSDDRPRYPRAQQYGNNQGYRPRQNNYNNRQGSYSNRPQNGYNRDNRQGGQRPARSGGFNNRPYGSNNRPQGASFGARRPQNNRFNNRKPNNRNKAPKTLLVSKEQLEQIELLYKLMLPLPNPDAHEVIGEKIGLEPRKVFFGINLVRQKMMLPKLPYPKRKLAITPDQMNAIKMLYEPLLPLPPIGCHKIIASQLKMDEWRVHVGIGLVRKQMGLDRWNQDRPDAPEEFKNQKSQQEEAPVVEEKKKRGRPKKSEETSEE